MGRKHARMTKGILQQIRSAIFFPSPSVINAKCIIKATDAHTHTYIFIYVCSCYVYILEILPRNSRANYRLRLFTDTGVIFAALSCIKQRREQINKIALNNSPNAIYYVCVFNQRHKLSPLDLVDVTCLINENKQIYRIFNYRQREKGK